METQLVNRYVANMRRVLSCYDRILITGTLPRACYAGHMTSFLYSRGSVFLTMPSLRNLCVIVFAHVPIPPSALSRQLAPLRMLGLIKKVAHTYRYYLTRLGRSAIAAACSITRFNIIPAMAGTQ